jgi:serine/threonine protein kinase
MSKSSWPALWKCKEFPNHTLSKRVQDENYFLVRRFTHLLNAIVFGTLTSYFTDSYGNPRLVPNSRGKKRKPNSKTLAQVLRCNDHLFVDFVSRCLDWDPEKRMTPDEGMFHEWVQESSHKSVSNRQSFGARYSEGTLTPPSSAAKLYRWSNA